MLSNPPVIATGPGSAVSDVEFFPDGRSVACRDLLNKEKAFDVYSGAVLPGAPRWEPCMAVERGCTRGRAGRVY
jgi:hypothetical protein